MSAAPGTPKMRIPAAANGRDNRSIIGNTEDYTGACEQIQARPDVRLQASREWLLARRAGQPQANLPDECSARAEQHQPSSAAAPETPTEAHSESVQRRRLYEAQAEIIDAGLADRGVGRFRRRSDFRRPPKNNTDRNFIDKVWRAADMIARKTWETRKKGKHGGDIGTVALEVMRTLLFRIKTGSGELYPSLITIAKLSRKSKQAIVTAIRVLVRMGFLTVHRRVKRIQTPYGVRVVQDSNAYQYHLPASGLGALAMAVFCGRPSESTKLDAIQHQGESIPEIACGSAERGLCREEVDRWWLAEPLQAGNGSWR